MLSEFVDVCDVDCQAVFFFAVKFQNCSSGKHEVKHQELFLTWALTSLEPFKHSKKKTTQETQLICGSTWTYLWVIWMQYTHHDTGDITNQSHFTCHYHFKIT